MRRAFTLIELLVVIAIIAILAAILFPVFAQAKRAAKNSVNIANMKQIGTAARLYTGDWDSLMPSDNVLGMAGGGANIRAVDDPYGLPAVLSPYTKSKDIWWAPNGKESLKPYGISYAWSSNKNVAGADPDMFEKGSSDNVILWDAYLYLTPASGVRVVGEEVRANVKSKNDVRANWNCTAMGGKGVHWLYADSHVKGEYLRACPANQ